MDPIFCPLSVVDNKTWHIWFFVSCYIVRKTEQLSQLELTVLEGLVVSQKRKKYQKAIAF